MVDLAGSKSCAWGFYAKGQGYLCVYTRSKDRVKKSSLADTSRNGTNNIYRDVDGRGNWDGALGA